MNNAPTNNDSLSSLQHLLLEQKYIVLNGVNNGGDHLDNKAMGLVQAASLIIALTNAVAIPSAFAGGSLSPWATVGIVISFLAFILMIGAAVRAWTPSASNWPGSLDWDEMYDDVILKENDDGYAKILSDCVDATRDNLERNAQKARLVKIAAILLIIQITGLLFVALLA